MSKLFPPHGEVYRLLNCDARLVVLLVEGYRGSNVKDVSLKKRYLSTFTHTMFRDNIPVYHTVNIQDTFEFLHHLATEMALGKLERSADYMERTKYTDNIQMARKSNLTPERGIELQLACIPGISAKMARYGGSLRDTSPMTPLALAWWCGGFLPIWGTFFVKKFTRAVEGVYPNMMSLCAAYHNLGTDEWAKHNLLAELTFRGTSGKEQRLASRSSKIYQYISGQTEAAPAKPKQARKKKEKLDAGESAPKKKRIKSEQ